MPEFAETILHVDMDAFYVEVERLRRPELGGVPVVIGGLGGRGVVASASYEAREHGVRSAMPMSRARRLCPSARFVAPDHGRYQSQSRLVFEILRSVTPAVEPLSIDEAFLDIAGLRLHYASPHMVGAEVRARLRTDLSLPASVGIASNKFLAKLASEAAKPDGMLVVAAGTELDFLHPLEVRRLWGVGEATHAALEELGVETVGDLAALPRDLVVRRLGDTLGHHLWELSWARDPRRVETASSAKSISVEVTYDRDLTAPAAIDDALFRHAERLARRLRRSGYATRTVHLKIRFGDFTTVTRSITLDAPVDETGDLVRAGRLLLAKVPLQGKTVRLLGLGGTALADTSSPRQMALGGAERRALLDAADEVRARFGEGSLEPARLRGPPRRGSAGGPADSPGNAPAGEAG